MSSGLTGDIAAASQPLPEDESSWETCPSTGPPSVSLRSDPEDVQLLGALGRALGEPAGAKAQAKAAQAEPSVPLVVDAALGTVDDATVVAAEPPQQPEVAPPPPVEERSTPDTATAGKLVVHSGASGNVSLASQDPSVAQATFARMLAAESRRQFSEAAIELRQALGQAGGGKHPRPIGNLFDRMGPPPRREGSRSTVTLLRRLCNIPNPGRCSCCVNLVNPLGPLPLALEMPPQWH